MSENGYVDPNEGRRPLPDRTSERLAYLEARVVQLEANTSMLSGLLEVMGGVIDDMVAADARRGYA